MAKAKRVRSKWGHIDFFLLILVTILVIFGVVMVFSASYYYSINATGTPYSYLWKQGVLAVSGFALMLFFSIVDYHVLRKVAPLAAVAELILLGLIFTPLGITINNATRWIGIPGVSFTIMPGELAKPAIILFAAGYFAKDMERARSFSGLLPLAAYTLLCCGMIVVQPNLSTALTVAIIAIGIAFVAGMQWRWVGLMACGGGLGAFYLFRINDGYWHARVVSFLDPFADALGEGFQVVQSLLALGTGGVLGQGLGKSVQKNLYLPEPQNDFILAIIGEELGFVGILLLMIVYLLTVARIFYISLRAKDNFGMLLGSGVAIMIGAQVILNVAVVTSSMPPTGIALPFISYGGNSLWILMSLVGIVLNISRQAAPAEAEDTGGAQGYAAARA